MKRTFLLLALAIAILLPQSASAEEPGDSNDLEKARTAAFDKRVFAGPIGDKASACFVRRYTASHMAQHPKQKVSSMKLLLTAEKAPDEATSYAYKVGVQLRNRPGNFDGGSSCSHMVDDDNIKVSFSCDVECGGGGLELEMATDEKAVIAKLEVIGLHDRKHPRGDAFPLEAGTDDKEFRLDRVDAAECTELFTNKVASLQRK